jgi:hypothetical protein
VRLDQPKLSQGLSSNPLVAFQLNFSLVTNPITGGSGTIAPGPAGQRQAIRTVVERAPSAMDAQTQQRIQAAMMGGASDVRMRTLAQMATLAQAFLNPQGNDQSKAKGKELLDILDRLTDDNSAPVAAWARYQLALVRPLADRAKSLSKMAASEYWPERLLGAYLALATGGDEGKQVMKQLSSDEQPYVKRFAEAGAYDLAHPTTQPTTAPAEAIQGIAPPLPTLSAPPASLPATATPAPSELNK